ncbi:MAG TPA: prepilin-type N-terminal cleavage/methylation domain-containing protein [Polyangiales bacterium]|nr:prepilin-type N-terminal cleavage/methylation domain-containing protein [Polyangiales bacterium]
MNDKQIEHSSACARQEGAHQQSAQKQRARRARKRRQGMTLIEIMIVMVIMALVAAGAGFAIVPQLQKAKIKSTQQDAKSIAAAAEMYMAENKDCPTVQKLLDSKILNKKNHTKDAWDNEFTIECDDDGAVVKSGGPDGQIGNDDDIE